MLRNTLALRLALILALLALIATIAGDFPWGPG